MVLNDERLVAIIRGDAAPSAAEMQDVAAELLRTRRISRGDSRRALQLRRIRWSVENLIIKLEVLAETRDPNPEAVEMALTKVAERLSSLSDEIRAQPLELEEFGIASVISKWLRSDSLLNALEAREWSDIPDELATKIDRGEWKDVLRG